MYIQLYTKMCIIKDKNYHTNVQILLTFIHTNLYPKFAYGKIRC